MASTSGHVFVMRGDIRRLACDAWLMPCDQSGQVEPSWVAWPARAARNLGPPLPFAHWSRSAQRVRSLEGWPTHLPEPWLLHVELDELVPSSWIVEGMTSFVRQAALGLRGRRPRYGRTVPLLAVPVGVAGIGAADGRVARRATGALVAELLPDLSEVAGDCDVDVVIVAHSLGSLIAAQTARQQVRGDVVARAQGSLPPTLAQALPALSQAVSRRQLTVVLGPQLAQRCGIPSWDRMLSRLGEGGTASARQQLAVATLPDRTRTEHVLRAVGGHAAFVDEAAQRLTLPHHGLAHGLLASLGADPVISYAPDDLLEQALAAADQSADVVLDGPARTDGPRLLRMRGSPHRPSSLLASWTDDGWLRRREACARAMLQCLRHPQPQVLALGFQPGEDLVRSLDLVAAARTPEGPVAQPLDETAPPWITVLAEHDDPDLPALLPTGTQWLPLMASRTPSAADVRTAGRRLELVLDEVGSAVALASHFLDPDLRGLLTEGDQALARSLDDMLQRLPERAREGQAWVELSAWLTAQGRAEE